MALDYSKLSDEELEAIANDDYTKLSDKTLRAIATSGQEYEPGGAAPQFYPTGKGVNLPNVGQAVQTAKTIAGPSASALGSVAKTYLTNPAAALTDITMGAVGLPPPVAGTQIAPGVQESYQRVKDYLNKTGQFAPQPTPAPAPGAVPNELAQAAKVNQAIGPEGLANYMKSGQMPVGGAPAAEGRTFIQRLTQQFAPIAQRVAPVLNTVGRIAGPAGLAYNAYEASEFAKQAELGNRLAQGQGAMAQQAFRNINPTYGAPITKEQARLILQSGNARDIAAFGGEEKLRLLAQ